MRRFFFAVLLALLCAAPLPSGAFPGASPNPPNPNGPANPNGPGQNRFAQADTDGNNALNRAEFSAAFPEMRPAVFDMLDANRDGVISRAEWDSFRQTHTAGGMPPATQALPGQTGDRLPQRAMPPREEQSPATPGVSSAPENAELPLLAPPPAQPAPSASAATAGPPLTDGPGNAGSQEFPLLEQPKP